MNLLDSDRHVGFTGTQSGMTGPQIQRLSGFLKSLKAEGFGYFHHGDCIGADAGAHDIAVELGFETIIHPPENASKRAFKHGTYREPFPYLERNINIVQESDYMLATPKEESEQLRSGTWSTIRKARKLGKPLTIIFPSGRVVQECGTIRL